MKIKRLVICLTVVILGLIGCSRPDEDYTTQRPILEVSHMVQGIGAVEGKESTFDIQKFSYTLALSNNDSEEVYVKEIRVSLPADFEQRVTTKNFIINVDKTIPAKSYIEVRNSHEFDARGLSKDDIHKLNPHISSIKVITEKTINLENRYK